MEDTVTKPEESNAPAEIAARLSNERAADVVEALNELTTGDAAAVLLHLAPDRAIETLDMAGRPKEHAFLVGARGGMRFDIPADSLQGFARGIGASVHFIPVHLHSFYETTYGYRRGDFPVAEAAFDSLLSLPLWPGLSEDDVSYVADTLRELFEARAAASSAGG